MRKDICRDAKISDLRGDPGERLKGSIGSKMGEGIGYTSLLLGRSESVSVAGHQRSQW